MDAGNAKFLTMVCLGTSSIAAGLLPAWCIPVGSVSSSSLLISTLLCGGSGILLATSMVHMLPEVQETLPHSASLIVCLGFLLLYFLEEIIHTIKGGNKHSPKQCERYHEIRYDTYGATEQSRLTTSNRSNRENDILTRCSCDGDGTVCHISSQVIQQTASTSSHIGLLLALGVHAVLEGMAIGVQTSPGHILVLGGAVASHKLVVSFCLGMELMATNINSKMSVLLAVTIFSLSSVMGIGIGMLFTDPNVMSEVNNNAVNILQALAVGTLLYVTLAEVLPRERYRFHKNVVANRYTGIIQFFATLIGFGLMVATILLFDPHQHVIEKPNN